MPVVGRYHRTFYSVFKFLVSLSNLPVALHTGVTWEILRMAFTSSLWPGLVFCEATAAAITARISPLKSLFILTYIPFALTYIPSPRPGAIKAASFRGRENLPVMPSAEAQPIRAPAEIIQAGTFLDAYALRRERCVPSPLQRNVSMLFGRPAFPLAGEHL